MAIHRSQNFLSQQRLEASNLKSMESAVSFDFDALVGLGLSRGTPLVLKGLVLNSTGAINQLATSLTIVTASSAVWNYAASESGSVFTIPSSEADQQLTTTNPNVVGSFLNGTNYVGIDFFKTPDASTSDTAKFIDSDSNKEYGQVVPLARTLKYKIYISTQPFSATLNVVPIAKVVVNNGLVTSITDARPMMFRLGTGGDAPSAIASYTWGSRTENPVDISLNTSPSPFNGEDKSINNLKDWVDSAMTSLWELRGGTSWYSNTYRDHVKLTYGQPVMSNGDNIWFIHNEKISTGNIAKVASSVATVTFPVNHPFVAGSRFKIANDPADLPTFPSGTFTVLATPTPTTFTYDDGVSATAVTTQDSFINDTIAFSGLALLFENSGSASVYKDSIQSGSLVIEDKYCAFIDLDRSVNATLSPQVRPLYSLSSPTLPGRRHIIAWRDGTYVYGKDKNYEAGRTFLAATTAALGLVKLNQVSPTPAAPVVVSIMANGRIEVLATGGNTDGATFMGSGLGAGVFATGGATGPGIEGRGGAGGGFGGSFLGTVAASGIQATSGNNATAGVEGYGTGTARGGYFQGGVTNGPGVDGIGAGNGYGVGGYGAGTGPGGSFLGGANGHGVVATGAGTGNGVVGTGIIGVIGVGGAGSISIEAQAGGAGATGVKATGGAAGIGVWGVGGAGNYAGDFYGGAGAPAVRATRNDGLTASPAIISAGTIDLDTSAAPAPGAAVKNKVTRQNFSKAGATFTLNNTVAPTVGESHNIDSITQDLGTGIITVNIAQDMMTNNYRIILYREFWPTAAHGYLPSIASRNVGSFTLTFFDNTGAGLSAAAGSTTRINFEILGDQ